MASWWGRYSKMDEMANGTVDVSEEQKNKITFDQESRDEKSKIGIMRTLVEAQDPSSKEVEDSVLRRFLGARDLDIEKASKIFLKYRSWRRSFVPNGSISANDIRNEVAHNKLFMQGVDRQGQPVAVILACRHKPSESTLEGLKRFTVYSFDKLCERMAPGKEKFVAVVDLKGWGYSNCDIRGYVAILSILQEFYPERLGRMFLVHVPYIFMATWKVIYPFIDSKTTNKIIFVEDKKLKATLGEDIDESQLPEIYGGKLSLVPIQEC